MYEVYADDGQKQAVSVLELHPSVNNQVFKHEGRILGQGAVETGPLEVVLVRTPARVEVDVAEVMGADASAEEMGADVPTEERGADVPAAEEMGADVPAEEAGADDPATADVLAVPVAWQTVHGIVEVLVTRTVEVDWLVTTAVVPALV